MEVSQENIKSLCRQPTKLRQDHSNLCSSPRARRAHPRILHAPVLGEAPSARVRWERSRVGKQLEKKNKWQRGSSCRHVRSDGSRADNCLKDADTENEHCKNAAKESSVAMKAVGT